MPSSKLFIKASESRVKQLQLRARVKAMQLHTSVPNAIKTLSRKLLESKMRRGNEVKA
jgi:hypothetical protein